MRQAMGLVAKKPPPIYRSQNRTLKPKKAVYRSKGPGFNLLPSTRNTQLLKIDTLGATTMSNFKYNRLNKDDAAVLLV
ncbi:hypothetical protein ACLUS7_10965, partial [Enterobacterales bacterium BD_CKDN230030183-1A_HGKHYDSX7]